MASWKTSWTGNLTLSGDQQNLSSEASTNEKNLTGLTWRPQRHHPQRPGKRPGHLAVRSLLRLTPGRRKVVAWGRSHRRCCRRLLGFSFPAVWVSQAMGGTEEASAGPRSDWWGHTPAWQTHQAQSEGACTKQEGLWLTHRHAPAQIDVNLQNKMYHIILFLKAYKYYTTEEGSALDRCSLKYRHTHTHTFRHGRTHTHTRTHIAQLLVNRWKQCDTSSEQRKTQKKTPHVKQLIVVYWLKCAAECFAALPVVSSQVCDLDLGSLSYIVHLSGSTPRQSGEEPTTQNSTFWCSLIQIFILNINILKM